MQAPDTLDYIDRVIVDAILAGRLTAGTRLGEQSLSIMFSVSRTMTREALLRVETTCSVKISPRPSWLVKQAYFD
ncbi:GntR family transcriptional regulator, partial [Methylobacterium sp. J-048]|uniref:GntR family transcriptional regulator n=1 Tax=Methylobacterium sp. J-048 TaxID=2836635 RepID=UPI001FB87B63